MAIQEPQAPDELFSSPFANNGDKVNIPLTSQTSGEVNWADGFGVRYNIVQKDGGLIVPREAFNQIFYMLSKKILDFKNYIYTKFLKADNSILTNLEAQSAEIQNAIITKLNANSAEIKALIVQNLTAENAVLNNAQILGGTIIAESALIGNNEMPILKVNTGETLIPTPLPSASGKELVNAEWVRNFMEQSTPRLDYVEKLTIEGGANESVKITLPTQDINAEDGTKNKFLFEIKTDNGDIYHSLDGINMKEIEDTYFLALPTTNGESLEYNGAKTGENSVTWKFNISLEINETLKTNTYKISPFNYDSNVGAYIKIYFKKIDD